MTRTDEPGLEEMLEEMLRAIRRGLKDNVDALANDRHGKLPLPVLGRARELGLFGLSVPEDYGGLGLGLTATCRIVSETATIDRSLATCIGLHNGLGTWPLLTLGTPEQKEKWLPRLASGESIAAFAATEANAGSDLASVATHVAMVGDGLRLNGEKQYVTNGALAGVYTVLARVRGAKRRYQLLCVPRETQGLSVGAEEHKLGIRASSTTPLLFDDARLDADAVLGDKEDAGSGLRDSYRALALGRAVMSAGCIGTARRAFEQTLEHVGSRRQFRRPIGVFGASRAHVVAMASRIFAMESLIDHLGTCHRRGEAIESLTSAAKVFCSESAFEVSDRALQLHGAMGMMEDTGVALLARDCRVTRIFEGANDVLLVFLGAELLSGGIVPDERKTHPDTALHACEWKRASDRLEELCGEVRKTLGVRVVERQDLLQLVARSHIALLTASICMARANATPDLSSAAALRGIDDANRELARRPSADAWHEVTFSLTDQLYAGLRPTCWQGPCS